MGGKSDWSSARADLESEFMGGYWTEGSSVVGPQEWIASGLEILKRDEVDGDVGKPSGGMHRNCDITSVYRCYTTESRILSGGG
jgi:hypothetical protein